MCRKSTPASWLISVNRTAAPAADVVPPVVCRLTAAAMVIPTVAIIAATAHAV
jgi:hypothetical protein